MKVERKGWVSKLGTVADMKDGQLAVCRHNETCDGEILFATKDGEAISLHDGLEAYSTYEIELLQPGDQVVLTQE